MEKMKMVFGIGIVLLVVTVLAISAVPAVNAATGYFVPLDSSADTGYYEYVSVYAEIAAGETLCTADLQIQFDRAHANITKCKKVYKEPSGADQYCFNTINCNFVFTDDGYMWGGTSVPHRSVWDDEYEVWEWEPCPTGYITGPATVGVVKYKVEAQGTPGESPFNFGFEDKPSGCNICLPCNFFRETGEELDVTWTNGTFTHESPVSCDTGGTEKNAFVPGDKVYVKACGLKPSTSYKIWIQDNPVNEGYTLTADNCTNCAGVDWSVVLATSASGCFEHTEIWNISATAPITNNEYDIVVDRQGVAGTGTFDAADDGIDDATVVGFAAPVPEMATIALFGIGLLMLAGYVHHRRRRIQR